MFKKNGDRPQFSEGIRKELKENGKIKKLDFDKKKLFWIFVTVVLMILLVFVLWQSYSFNRKAETESQDAASSAEEKPAGTSEEKKETEEQAQESYRVVEGDTLSTIAEKFGISWQKLAEANNLTEESTLRIGQKLVIPK